MNDEMKLFMNNFGALCETWTLTYNNFLKQGMTAKDAMTHTQGFMTSLMTASMQLSDGSGK